MVTLKYASTRPTTPASDPTAVTRFLLPLMLRNMSSAGFAFTDPNDPNSFSAPGCIIASPSFERSLSAVRQNYVFNWTRDAAVTAIELAAAQLPERDGSGSGPLDDYVSFAALCLRDPLAPARASYTIQGRARSDWTDQNDGPALQILAILSSFDALESGSQGTAVGIVQKNLEFLMGAYQQPSFNLWEEVKGQSFFTRSVQLRCLQEIKANHIGARVPDGVDDAIAWLRDALAGHWDGQRYVSILQPEAPRSGYDPNIDIVMAAVYGAVEVTDPKVLATTAQVWQQWADPASPVAYPVNAADADRDLGPLFGRYPGDVYDGDTDARVGDHPWALCTANVAELCYDVAAAVKQAGAVPYQPLSEPFFGLLGIDARTAVADAVQRLVDAGDRMLRAVVFHSDHLELSEQFDGTSGYEKSVRNLTWSYAAYLSAARSRTAALAG
jgi:glucoamylase